ncbi:hypothetical protein N7462_007907 [Penicillium macrosclerotiorum]|uniref:uncharacterized protein n=1 Tax=Penicillium macrosclerotiorum TaxID=303699 RepID=UPI002547826A|nr:uncharacterized protein N7462_007907 [Penicillium macrosclerotiorum]KAJ5679663.1 hypothetical protein N7462_007907 [Penicillium macrosclerotiorum]
MKKPEFQYAQLPQFTYQSFERRYQTFDRNNLTFSCYPVVATTNGLTEDKPQDTKEPSAAEPEKEPAPAETKADEPENPPDNSSASPEVAGKCE